MHKQTHSKGNPYGTHRVLKPHGVLPQPAEMLDNNMDHLWDNEILVDVHCLNIDSASFTQIKAEAGDDPERIKARIHQIVQSRGKMHNPVTGSGGMFLGRVAAVGQALEPDCPLVPGDSIASLVSLSLTPLKIEQILEIKPEQDQVKIKGQAILFQRSLYAKMPDDFSAEVALAVFDVCGAPAQTAKLVSPGATVVVVGVSGKSGLLCAYEARRRAGSQGRIIGVAPSQEGISTAASLGFCHDLLQLDARDAVACYEAINQLSRGEMADVVINCVNIPNTELSSILMCKDGGTVYFFSMATSFTQAALGAEGTAKDVTMLIGNGYTRGHADFALNILRESEPLQSYFKANFG